MGYKRYHPVSHDLNHDPQVLSLRREFGDWAALAWLEVLSVADRNEGIVTGTIDEIADRLAPVSLAKYRGAAAKTAKKMIQWWANRGWIQFKFSSNLSQKQSENGQEMVQNQSESYAIQIVKYAEYHRTREANLRPPTDRTTELLNTSKDKRGEVGVGQLKSVPPSAGPSAAVSEKKKLDPEVIKRMVEQNKRDLQFDEEQRKEIWTLAKKIPARYGERFSEVPKWVGRKMNKKYPAEPMLEALRTLHDQAHMIKGQVWPYFDAVLKRTFSEYNFREHERRKAEERKPIGSMAAVVGSLAESMGM